MSGRIIVFIILMFLNVCVVIGYIFWNYIRRNERALSIWMKAFLMLVCPVIGPAFLFLAYWFYKLFMSQTMDLEDVIFNKEKVENYTYPDEEREKNIVSLEEALLITDKRSLRTLMMNVIKGDYRNSLSSISLALNSEDSETSHYAASVLQDVLNDYRVHVQNQYQRCQNWKKTEESEDIYPECCIELIEYMNPILEQHVFTDMEQQSMVAIMDEVCEWVWNIDPDKIQSSIYEIVSMRTLELKAYEICKKWCIRAMQQYPSALASYTCQLKLYFSSEDKENFFRVMNELKRSEIMLDNETLELVRTFM